MKKVLTILMLLVYFTASTGFTVCVHFCMDKFDSAQLSISSDDRCAKCGMHKDGGCCKDVVKVVKLQNAHLASRLLVSCQPESSPLETVRVFVSSSCQAPCTSKLTLGPGPPLPGQEICIQHCVFRI